VGTCVGALVLGWAALPVYTFISPVRTSNVRHFPVVFVSTAFHTVIHVYGYDVTVLCEQSLIFLVLAVSVLTVKRYC
jgi:purine-cytosine permease-like protein